MGTTTVCLLFGHPLDGSISVRIVCCMYTTTYLTFVYFVSPSFSKPGLPTVAFQNFTTERDNFLTSYKMEEKRDI